MCSVVLIIVGCCLFEAGLIWFVTRADSDGYF